MFNKNSKDNAADINVLYEMLIHYPLELTLHSGFAFCSFSFKTVLMLEIVRVNKVISEILT